MLETELNWTDLKSHVSSHSNKYIFISYSNYYKQVKRKDNTDLTILAEGELVAAKFKDVWYRARVVNAAEDLVQVLKQFISTDDILESFENKKRFNMTTKIFNRLLTL